MRRIKVLAALIILLRNIEGSKFDVLKCNHAKRFRKKL